MSQYSEMLGSFIRTGNFPLEADYIFPTYNDLVTFYQNDEAKAILHKGLLKIVEDNGNGNQALYWVTSKEDKEFQFECLITGNSIDEIYDKLSELEEKLDQEIKDRKEAIDSIYGTDEPSEIPEDLNSIIELAEAVKELKMKTQTLLDQLKATVGTTQDDIIEYLKTLPFESLTKVSIALHKFLETVDKEDPTISTLPEIQHFLAGYTDSDNLHTILHKLVHSILGDPLPSEGFNTLRDLEDKIKQLKSKVKQEVKDLQDEIDETQKGVGLDSSGRFSPDAYTHYLKESTSVMNALRTLDSLLYNVITTTNLTPEDTESVDLTIKPYRDETVISAKVKLSSKSGNQIVIQQDGLYHNIDFDYTEGRLNVLVNGAIVKYFDLGLSGLVSDGYYDTNTEQIVIVLSLPGGEKQEVKIPAGSLIEEWEILNNISSAVVLHKDRSVSGKDTLSADVKISNNTKNILVKQDGQLLVDGSASNIRMSNGYTVESSINDIKDNLSEYSSNINQLRDSLKDEINRAEDAEKALQESIEEVEQSVVECKQECSENIQNVTNQIDKTLESMDNLFGVVSDLQKTHYEFEVKVQNDQAEQNNKITELGVKVDSETTRATQAEQNLQNSIDLINERLGANFDGDKSLVENVASLNVNLAEETARAKKAEHELQDQIDLHLKDYDNVSIKLTEEINRALQAEKTLTEQLATKVGKISVTKLDDRNYQIYVDGEPIPELISIPSQAIIKNVTYKDGILTIKFNADVEDVRIDFSQILSEALVDINKDIDQLKTTVQEIQNKDVVEWNITGDNKAIYLEKDNSISAKFENEDTRTPILQVLKDKTHLGSNHFPTSLDSSVRPEVNENGNIEQIAYLSDLNSLKDEQIKSLEDRISILEEAIDGLEWKNN